MRLIDADALYKNLGFAEECKDCDHQYNSVFCDSSTWQVVCDAIYEAPTIDAVPVVRCKDCKWYDPPHIDHGGGKRTDVEDDFPHVSLSVGINVSGRCVNTLREYCCNHNREDPDDYERLVKFRNRMDYCSDGERRDDE